MVPFAGHVVLHEALAPLGNGGPDPEVVGLDGEPPAVAVEIVVNPDFAVAGDNLDDRVGNSGGDNAEEEEEDSWDEGLTGSHFQKSKELRNQLRERFGILGSWL